MGQGDQVRWYQAGVILPARGAAGHPPMSASRRQRITSGTIATAAWCRQAGLTLPRPSTNMHRGGRRA